MLSLKKIDFYVFLAVLGSSMLGSQLFGISLNKICLIPLILYLLVYAILKSVPLRIKKSTYLILLFYLFAAISALLSLRVEYSNLDGYKSKSINFFIQAILVYIPLILLLSNYCQKKHLFFCFKKALLLTCRIHAFMAVFEFVLFVFCGIEPINAILGLFYKDAQCALINLGSFGIFLRPTGLNIDPAYFGVVLVFGFVFEKKRINRLILFFVACLSMSRTTIIVLLFLFVIGIDYKSIKLKKLVLLIILVLLGAIILLSNQNLNKQILGMLSRFDFVLKKNTADIGTMRHILYIPKSFEIYFTQYNPMQMLIGGGPRQSGTILAQSGVMNEYLLDSMFVESWTIECDVSELLLGYGIVGFTLFYVNVFKIRKTTNGKKFFWIILLYSIMYDISSSTFVQLIIIVLVSCMRQEIRIKEVASNGTSKCYYQLL